MIKRMRLQARFRVENDQLIATCQMYDNTPFEIAPPEHTYELHEEFLASRQFVNGFVHVDVTGTQYDDVCYIKLPCPSLNHGSHLTVKSTNLMPHGVTISDFGPSETAPENIAAVADQVLQQN